MAKRNVDIAIRARDEASKKFRKIASATGGLTSALKKAAGAAAVFFGTRALFRFGKESLVLFGRQEEAVISLADALENLGLPRVTKEYEDFATEIQRVTRLGDEQVLELLTMGATMAKLSGKDLKDATTASIGLAKAFKIDVVGAMRLVARAAVGDTGSLSRYGITLDKTLTKQEKFNAVLKIGADNFDLAKGAALTYNGQMEQTANIIGDVRELIGSKLAPTVLRSAKQIRDWASENQDNIGRWTEKSVAFVLRVKDSFIDFAKFMRNDFTNSMGVVWDSFLILLKAAFDSAVILAVEAGKGITRGLQAGVLGVEPVVPGQKKAFKAAGGEVLSSFDVLREAVESGQAGRKDFKKFANLNFTKVAPGRFIRNEDLGKFLKSFKAAVPGQGAFSQVVDIGAQAISDIRETSNQARGIVPPRLSRRAQAFAADPGIRRQRGTPTFSDNATLQKIEKGIDKLVRLSESANSRIPGQGRLQAAVI